MNDIMANSVDPDETARCVRAVLSGSALFAKVFNIYVFRDERANLVPPKRTYFRLLIQLFSKQKTS